MSTLDRALQIAAAAHAGAKDRQGSPYILHPLRVMLRVSCEGEAAQIVAALHDVVEDTSVTFDDLRAEGFAEDVLTALELLTHREGQSYTDYVIACKPNPVARAVKLADLRDNANLARLQLRPEKFAADSARSHRYTLSFAYLTDRLSEADYRRLMPPFEK